MEHINLRYVDWQNNVTKLNRANMVAGINNLLEILKNATNNIIDKKLDKDNFGWAIADNTYNSNFTYNVGDTVYYVDEYGGGYLYKCETAVTTPEPFDANKWSKTTLERLIWTKQDILVSGTNIKTIGGESVVGDGNISFKTVDGDSIIGSGDLPFKSINGVDVSGSGNISLGDSVGIQYLTTLPTSANADGLKIVVCNSEPQNKYDGYIYLIKEN